MKPEVKQDAGNELGSLLTVKLPSFVFALNNIAYAYGYHSTNFTTHCRMATYHGILPKSTYRGKLRIFLITSR